MIHIKKNKLKTALLKNIYLSYFIIGTEFITIQEIEKKILFFFKKKSFSKIITIHVNSNIDWKRIFQEYCQKSLFCLKKIFILEINQTILNQDLIINIKKILKLDNKNIILIFKFTIYQTNNNILKFFMNNLDQYHSVLITVNKMNNQDTKKWIKKKLDQINLYLQKKTIHLLINCYKNNLLILSKFLETLKLMYIQENTVIHEDIKKIITDTSNFNILNWTKALLFQDKIYSLKILKFFKINKLDISYLIKNIQQIIIILLNIKKKNTYQNYLKNLQENYIEENIIKLIKQSKYTYNVKKIYKIINILTKIEINFKQHKYELIWTSLKTLIMIF